MKIKNKNSKQRILNNIFNKIFIKCLYIRILNQLYQFLLTKLIIIIIFFSVDLKNI